MCYRSQFTFPAQLSSTCQVTSCATGHYHYRKQSLCRVPQALGKAQKTLGKGFAECNTRQTAHDIYSAGKRLFAECFLSGTRQKTLPRTEIEAQRKKVSWRSGDGHGAFADCQISGTWQTFLLCRVSNFRHSANLASLPSVKVQALGKASSFVVCQSSGTRQSFFLCRVSNSRHSANFRPLPSVEYQALGKHVPECIEFWLLCRVS